MCRVNGGVMFVWKVCFGMCVYRQSSFTVTSVFSVTSLLPLLCNLLFSFLSLLLLPSFLTTSYPIFPSTSLSVISSPLSLSLLLPFLNCSLHLPCPLLWIWDLIFPLNPSKCPHYCHPFASTLLKMDNKWMFIWVDPFIVWVVPMGIRSLNGAVSVLGCTSGAAETTPPYFPQAADIQRGEKSERGWAQKRQ